MKNRIFLLLASTLLVVTTFAQSHSIRGKQIEEGSAENQVWMTDATLKGGWRTSPFLFRTDSLSATGYATPHDLSVVDNKHFTNGTFSSGTMTLTRGNGQTMDIGLSGYFLTIAQRGAVNGVAPLGANGQIPSQYIPAQGVSDVFVVASENAMLALATATKGDFANRTDVSKTYILNGDDPSQLSNWVEFLQATGIASVNSKTGPAVVLNTDDISEGATNKYFSTAAARTSISGAGPIAYNNATGVISMNTSGVTTGTYNNITVDAYGRATGGTNVAYLTSADLAPYATKTSLSTAGGQPVHWSNVTNVPTSVMINFEMQESTGTTSSTITLNNTPKFGGMTPVFFNGVMLHQADYSISGNTLTLGVSRTTADAIRIMNFY